jgi:F0F1-type ATP synthase delta subunit
MRVYDYSTSICELIESGTSLTDALTGLKKVLESRGHAPLYPKILKQLMRDLSMRASQKTAVVTVATQSGKEELASDIALAAKELGAETYNTITDATLIGGFKVETQDKRVDKSHKKVLLTLYRSLIKS